MARRINVMLPDETIQTLDRLAKPGERSRLINKAVQHYAATRSAEGLREELKRAAIRDRDLDLEAADDWFAVDHETWPQFDNREEPAPASRGAAKSTSRHSTRR